MGPSFSARGRRGLARARASVSLAIVAAIVLTLLPPAAPVVAAPQPGFVEDTVFSGLTNPAAIRFSPDGRIFIAEKSGLIKVFDNLTDPTPTVFADLRTNVHNFWDRGLLGMALDPTFPVRPYVYVLYAHNAAIGGAAPRWPTSDGTTDECPTPPGPTSDGCVVSGRLSRLTAAGSVMTGPEQVLIEEWCQQYPSHSTGSLAFGADGALYVSAGDGASFNFTDYGQDGSPLNPCGDPPGGVGATLSPPTARGGALRAQSMRRPAGEPVSLDGTILRVDPDTGDGLPGNPFFGASDPNRRRIVAYGLRNPFRIMVPPGSNEVWIGDVGWNDWEEINRISAPTDGSARNFGWPCYEGNGRQSGYDGANLDLCESLYSQGASAVTAPYFTYNHSAKVVPGEVCPAGSSSVAGVTFQLYSGNTYPADYQGALFFADYSRDCIWVMKKGANGLPSPSLIQTFVSEAANPVDLQIGPGGNLFYVDFDGGTIRRIRFGTPPTAVAAANPTTGPLPLTITFDGSGSTPGQAGDVLSYAWDLDNDGQFDDATGVQTTRTYTQAATHTVRLQVSDNRGNVSISAPLVVTPGNTPPTVTITAPTTSTTWKVGDVINFAGSATDGQDGPLPATALAWKTILHHCPSNCHTHPGQTFADVASGSFNAPDHEYPSHLELILTATDATGLSASASVLVQPQAVALGFQSNPAGLQLAVGSTTDAAPFTRTVIVGSSNSVSAVTPQSLAGSTYTFASWSDGGAQTHTIVAGASPQTYTATYTAAPTVLVGLTTIGSNLDSNATGMAEAFQYTASASGTVGRLSIYLDATSTASRVIVGLYANNTATNNPGALLTQATITAPAAGAWNTATVATPVAVTQGTMYWLAALTPTGATGTIQIRDGASGGRAQNSAQATLAALPATWSPGSTWPNSPMSAYASINPAPDTTPPTVTATMPTGGATGIAVGSTVTATFNEPMDPATITTNTIQLSGPSGAVPATVAYNAATLTATLTPSSALASLTLYTATVRGGATDPRVKDAAGNALAANQTWSFTTVGDTTPPTITGRSPTGGATNVSLSAIVTATFNEAMDPASITAPSVFELRTPADIVVPATVAYNATTRVATLTPSGPLAGATTYTARIKGGATDPRAKDLAGNALASDDAWSFTTLTPDTTPPTVTNQTPASGAANVATSTTVTATFNEAMTAATIDASTFELRTPTNALVNAAVTYNATTRVATLTPSAALAASTTYTATVRGGATDPRVKDAAGNALAANQTWSFTTAATPTVLLGVTAIRTNVDSNATGVAEAFQYTASATGTVSRLSLYLDAGSTASTVIVGLYTNNNATNNPGTLLAQATIAAPAAGAWNTVTVPTPVAVTQGATYWLAVLAPTGATGTVRFRDGASGGRAQNSAQSNLAALPATWSPGATWGNLPMSAYGST